MAQLPRGTRFRLRPIDFCLNRSFRVGRPQPHSRSPRSLQKSLRAGLRERGAWRSEPKAPVVQVQRTHVSIAFGERGGPPSDPYCFRGASQVPSEPIALGARGKSPNETSLNFVRLTILPAPATGAKAGCPRP